MDKGSWGGRCRLVSEGSEAQLDCPHKVIFGRFERHRQTHVENSEPAAD